MARSMRPGRREERGDEFERAADYDADEAEGQQDEPDERVEDQGYEGQGPAKESEEAEEKEVEHRVFVSPEDRTLDGRKSSRWWMMEVWRMAGCSEWWGWIGRVTRGRGSGGRSGLGFGRLLQVTCCWRTGDAGGVDGVAGGVGAGDSADGGGV